MKLKLKQVRSSAGLTAVQLANLRSLKLGKIGRISILEKTSEVEGRLRVIKHLLEVSNVKA